jgi:hypothetical protein
MAYRLAGRSTEFCSCSTPCPCAFGQAPDNEHCTGMIYMEVEEGDVEGTSVAGTKLVFADFFGPGPWMSGGLTAAVVLDANASGEQRAALTRVLSGELGGDATAIGGLVSEMRGFFEAPFEGTSSDEEVSFSAGEYAEGTGAVLKNVEGDAPIRVSNPAYILPDVTAGKATKVRINVAGIEYDGPGTGMWTGPFELRG